MGGGSYSSSTRSARSKTMGFATKSAEQIFTQREIHNDMSPLGLGIREARDSDEHPLSVPILLGLDVTASMGRVPHKLVKDGLPHIMEKIIAAGIADPQLMFMGIGDDRCDRAPLQVGQFESSDELLDKWLTQLFLEGGGGGNGGESYALAWQVAAHHTATDHFDKRGQKGYVFTIGDEPCHSAISRHSMDNIIGPVEADINADTVLELARERWNVYHIHVNSSMHGSNALGSWRERMGDNLITVESHEQIPEIIANIVANNEGITNETTSDKDVVTPDSTTPPADILL